MLKQLSFGAQVAEEEANELESYFVQTDQWDRILGGKIDIIRGEKGAGKSAIYLLLRKHAEYLFDRGILTISAETVRGATVFQNLKSDPPTKEDEFIVLWKLYILTLICHELRSYSVNDGKLNHIYGLLEEADLLENELNLSGLLRMAQAFARKLISVTQIEPGVEVDPNTLLPTGVSCKISLEEPTGKLRDKGFRSLDGMFADVNASLEKQKLSVWVLLDRLDVAFADSHELEANAIRALMRVYSDIRALDAISLKVFLREDIWKRVVERGFREASHLLRFEVMTWNNATLLNLTMKRILSNSVIESAFGVQKEEVLKDAKKQELLFGRMFPPQVEQGPQKATTFNWLVGRCADGTGKTAPRELIHLLNCVKDEEIKRLERGGTMPPNEQLFDRSVFKQALPTVSDTRLTTYLYAEYPVERKFIEKLKGLKSEQTPESLMLIWEKPRDETLKIAQRLVDLGFFEQRGDRQSPTFWVPFLYRDALSLVQGRAEMEG